jgi:hypothetical protein
MNIKGAVLAAFILGGLAVGRAADDAWRKLPLIADDKVDTNWVHVGYGGFVVDGDAILTQCDPKGLGLLVYRKEKLGNCQLRVVFKTKDRQSNAGVYVRLADGILARVGKPGPAFERDGSGTPSDKSMETVKAAAEREEGAWYAVHHGYEVQIAGSGDEFHRTGAIYSLAPSTAVARPAEWQTMLITLDGTKISVELDGKPVSRLDTASPNLRKREVWHEPKREPKRPEVGYIGLQNHDPGDEVWFREVSVRPLPRR